MQQFFIALICSFIFITNVDARSRNPRPADFDEIERLVNEDSEIYNRDMSSNDLTLSCGTIRYYVRVDHQGGTIKHFMCTGWHPGDGRREIAQIETRQFAYLNELDFKKVHIQGTATIGVKVNRIAIPCKANRDCNNSSSSIDKDKFIMFIKSDSIAQQIIELLKPN